ncbi:serine hydrolase domain-containing protein [Phytohabitans sp. LJ34]|uniref:serine hydrolase domain-containing protein n=1 Tax=Phytohabitans sp. LJ34 TaxID=3452217 RepID=UPI003F8A3F9B
MKAQLAAFVAIVAVAGGATFAAQIPAVARAAPVADRHQLQAGLDDLRDLGVVGTQGLVQTGDRVTRARSGVADRRTGAPMPPDGYFRIGSNTKTFVAVVVLQLVGEGRLALTDPVERWLPGVVSGNGNDGSRISVRQLLQQTSGIPDYLEDLPAFGSADGYRQHRLDRVTAADLVALAMRHEPVFAPGTHWAYSNTNYILAGMLIEKVTGRPWPQAVQSRIINPLRLRHTSYVDGRSHLPRPHARGYHQFVPGDPLVDTTVLNASYGGAAGGLVSTTTDLTRFWQALQRGQLLRPQQMTQMHDTVLAETFQGLYPGLRYGLGIFWAPNRCGGYWAHPGDLPGTVVVNAVTADGSRAAVVYMTTKLADEAAAGAVLARSFQLMDDAVCGAE